MEKDITFLSEQNQNCLVNLFDEAYKEEDDYLNAIVNVADYLISDSNRYDDILRKYPNVDKRLLNQMIFSNFLEMSYYRRENKIPIDDLRLNTLSVVDNADNVAEEYGISIFTFDMYQLVVMLNDVLLYFWHPSKTYSYNAVMAMQKNGFAQKLYPIYPLASTEHALTLSDKFSDKEVLIYTLVESMVNATERIIFSNGNYPAPDPGYMQFIANTLKQYNGTNRELPNLHQEVLEEFNSKTGIKENPYSKTLILETLVTTIRTKKANYIPMDNDEKYILYGLDDLSFTLEGVSSFYDKNEQKIISSLINDWNMFPYEDILIDTIQFRKVKQQGIKQLKKQFGQN